MCIATSLLATLVLPCGRGRQKFTPTWCWAGLMVKSKMLSEQLWIGMRRKELRCPPPRSTSSVIGLKTLGPLRGQASMPGKYPVVHVIFQSNMAWLDCAELVWKRLWMPLVLQPAVFKEATSLSLTAVQAGLAPTLVFAKAIVIEMMTAPAT